MLFVGSTVCFTAAQIFALIRGVSDIVICRKNQTIRRELAPETLSRIKAMQFLPDDGEEQDIVEAMLYLTSPRARFVTAETLRVTGGYAAGI